MGVEGGREGVGGEFALLVEDRDRDLNTVVLIRLREDWCDCRRYEVVQMITPLFDYSYSTGTT